MSNTESIGHFGAAAAAERFIIRGSKMTNAFRSMYKEILEEISKDVDANTTPLWSLIHLAEKIRAYGELQTPDTEASLRRCNGHVDRVIDGLEVRYLRRQDSMFKRLSWTSAGVRLEKDMFTSFQTLENERKLLVKITDKIIWSAKGLVGARARSGRDYLRFNIEVPGRTFDLDSSTRCLKALALFDHKQDREDILISKGSLVPGTCDWITEHKAFKEWDTSDSGVLWISGGPGTGKTMLSIYLTQYLEQHMYCQGERSPDILSFFFCSSQDNRRDNASAIVRGLLSQLLHQREYLVDRLLPAYRDQESQLFRTSSFGTLWNVLLNVLDQLSHTRVSLVLDGLDELDPTFLELLLPRFTDLVQNSPKLRIIVLSRENPKLLEMRLGGFPVIQLESEGPVSAFEQVVSSRVNEFATYRKFSTRTTQETRQVLTERSNKSYLWAQLTIEHLWSGAISPMEKHIQSFPDGLEKLLRWMLELISDHHQQKSILEIFKWCVFAVRPLAPGELAVAIGCPKNPHVDAIDAIKGILGHCSMLLNFTPDAVTLVNYNLHQLITETSGEWYSLPNAAQEQTSLASECLAHLEHGVLEPNYPPYESWDPLQPGQLGYSFGHYAGSYWDVHFRKSDPKGAESLFDKHQNFFSADSRTLDQFLRWRMNEGLQVFGGLPHVAAEFGLEGLMRRILTRAYKKSLKYSSQHPTRDWLQKTPLHRAARNGHISLANMLTGLRELDSEGHTPLHKAVISGSVPTVDSVLKAGADVNGITRESPWETPIEMAVRWNNLVVAKHLMDRKAELGRRDMSGEAVLMHAARRKEDRDDMLNLLISRSTPGQLKHVNKKGENLLHLACRNGLINVVLFLLKSGHFDVNLKDKDGNSCLHYAAEAEKNGAATTQLLLDQPGIQAECVNLNKQTPLDKALQFGEAATVRLWVDKMGASLPKPAAGTHFGALHVVSLWGKRETVAAKIQLLVDEYKIDPDIRTLKSIGDFSDIHESHNTWLWHIMARNYSCGESLLALAVLGGDAETVRILVEEYKADVHSDCRSCDGATALHIAAQSCRVDMVNLLLKQYKTNVNGLDQRQRTPLHALAARTPASYEENQYWEAMRALLFSGADVTLQDSLRKTARNILEIRGSKKGSKSNPVEQFDRLVAEAQG